MERRTFLTLVAGTGGLAGCPARSRDGESERTPGGTTADTPTGTPTEPTAASPRVPSLDGSWTGYQHDAANTGGTGDAGPTDDPSELWARGAIAGRPATAPAAADGAFVVVSTAGILYAREAEDGAVRWLASRTVGTDVPPVASQGTAVATDGEVLVGVAVASGRERWSVTLDGSVRGLVALDGRVIAATDRGVSAVSPADGTRRWHHPTDEAVVTGPGATTETVAVGLATGELLALDAADGTARWRTPLEPGATHAPAVGSGGVYVATGSRLVALDVETGDQRWDRRTDSPVATSPVVTTDAVYAVTLAEDAEGQTTPSAGDATPTATDVRWFRGTVLGLSTTDGDERWRATRTEQYNFTSGPPETLGLAVADKLVVVNLDGTLVTYDAASGEESWTARSGAVAPAVTGGVISTGTVGVSLASGSERWRLRTGDSVTGGPAVVDNTVYVGSDDNYLYAMSANAGTIEWAARTDDIIRAAPVVGDDAVYVGTIGGTLYAFDRADGSELWSAVVGGVVQSPALDEGTLYLGNFSQTVQAVDAADGTERWRTEIDSDRFVALEVAVADGAVYAGANGDLRAVETGDGTERWARQVGGRERVQSPPAAADGRVYVNIGEALRAFDTADGTERWTRSIAGNANEPPVVHDGVVYTSADETVQAVDAADGTERWRTSATRGALKLAATDDAVYGWGHDTPLLALDSTDGTRLWQDRSFEPSSPLAVADEFLFVGDRSGFVRALGPGRE